MHLLERLRQLNKRHAFFLTLTACILSSEAVYAILGTDLNNLV